MSGRFAGKIAIITGGGDGIGAATGMRFAKEGAAVILADKDEANAHAVCARITAAGGKAAACRTDVRSLQDIKAMLAFTASRFGPASILINNAGVGSQKRFLETPLEMLDTMLDVNLRGTFMCAQEAAREMVKLGGGAIVNVSSHSGLLGSSGRAAYAASKGGVIAMTRVMAVDLAPFGIRVNVIAPGPIDINVSRNMAQSFRFHEGFLAPFWGYHQGDIRIPDLPGDVNDQPFTTFFKLDNGDGKLYHYFALEPFQEDKQGLSMSLLVPADGIGPVKFYNHNKKSETLIGVSAVAGRVMASRKLYDWNNSKTAEHRPYIKDICGKRRFLWLTTIVTLKGSSSSAQGEIKKDYIAGSVPDVVLIDLLYRIPVWVDSKHPETWTSQLEKELGTTWKTE